MELLTIEDLVLINELNSRKYTRSSLITNTKEDEQERFRHIKKKLRQIANYLNTKYGAIYGPFSISVSPEANPVNQANTLRNVWATLFKGAQNKQYAAQISLVIDRQKPCLNVGFYFGRASGHNLTEDQRLLSESNLANLGIELSNAIINDFDFRANYDLLFDYGFTSYSEGLAILPSDWYNEIRINAKDSQITVQIYPNDFGVIETSTIDFYVSQVVFLMGGIGENNHHQRSIVIHPLSLEQMAKRAERLSQIGLKGELFVLETERKKLERLGINNDKYPDHVALRSSHFGFDILSLDENEHEIYIEVKSTTRAKEDANSKRFFISNNEFTVFENNKDKYFLYRVYSVEGSPIIEELNLENLNKKPDGYIVEY